MKLAPHSLRWRLQIWYGLLLVIVLCAFGFTAHHLERVERLRNVDNELQHRLSSVVSALRAGPPRRTGPPPPRTAQPGIPPGSPNLALTPEVAALFGGDSPYYFAVWMQQDRPVSQSANAPADMPRPDRADAATRERQGQLREAFIFAAPVDCVLVGRFIADEERALLFNAALLATAGGVLFLLGLVGGGWLIARAIRPIEDITGTAARIAEGDLTQRVPETDDQSELGRLSLALNQTFSRLEDAFAQQQRFTADAAHELRTPLTVLLTQVQTALARSRSAEEYRDTLEACQRSAQRMRKLLEALLQLARLDAREEPLQSSRFDIVDTASECLDLLKPVAREAGITLRREATSAPVEGDADRLAQVITNLLSNAIQHTPPGGDVTLQVRQEGSTTLVTVSDTGPGIAAKDLPHIFERFYRADTARSGSAGRTGLGLSIAKAIVEAHGGSITAESEAGKGAKFVVRLP
jgi:two-component system, OmpR family, sensor kinase